MPGMFSKNACEDPITDVPRFRTLVLGILEELVDGQSVRSAMEMTMTLNTERKSRNKSESDLTRKLESQLVQVRHKPTAASNGRVSRGPK